MRSPLTERYQRLMSIVDQIHSLEPDERNFILDLFVPEAEPEPEVKPARKARKKSASKKSPRASSLEQQIQKRGRRVGATNDDNDDVLQGGCADCGMAGDTPIHSPDGGYITYHPFKSPASPASDSSSANGGAGDLPANSETRTASAGNAVHEQNSNV